MRSDLQQESTVPTQYAPLLASFYRTFRLIHGNVSFEALKPSDRLTLASKCLDSYLFSDTDADSHAALFWIISGPHDEVLDLLVTACDSNDSGRIEKLAMLIKYSPRKLVFGRPQFAQSLLGKVSVSERN
jgi:hypothetical protein